MISRIFNSESDLNPGIERFAVRSIKIFLRFEDDFICLTSFQIGILFLGLLRSGGRKEIQATAVSVCSSFSKRVEDVGPAILRYLEYLEANEDAFCRFTGGGVQN